MLREKLNANTLASQTEQVRLEGMALREELEKVYTDEDIFWRQRSKVHWARDGDRNTSYFHQVAISWKEMNTIYGLFD